MIEKRKKRKIRHIRVRAKIKGTAEKPRFSVFRSNKHVFLQLINDAEGETLVSVSDTKADKKILSLPKTERARLAGKKLAEKAKDKKIKKAVFDRGGYIYHGRIKAAAEGAREGGLKF
jgi:large subunit ribosomal protein L18